MRNKNIFFLSALISLIFVVLLINSYVLSQNKFKVVSDETGAVCKSLKYSGEGKINIVYFADEKTTRDYSDFLFGFSPFNKNENKFNVFFIDGDKPNCRTYKGVATLCDQSETTRKAAVCPNDYVVVIDNSKSNEIRSSALRNIISLNAKHPKTVLAHEKGHTIGFLAEEYVPAEISSKARNCVPKGEKFLDYSEKETSIDGRFIGCSKEDYERSVEEGVMRSLSPKTYGYGTFNEFLMQERIEEEITNRLFITGAAIQNPEDCDEEYYLIEGKIDENGGMDTIKTSIETGCLPGNGYGDFYYSLKDDGATIVEGSFNPSLIFTDSVDGGEVLRNDNFVLSLPLIESRTTRLEIISSEGTKSRIQLNMGANACSQ